jgi:hypothetical protein
MFVEAILEPVATAAVTAIVSAVFLIISVASFVAFSDLIFSSSFCSCCFFSSAFLSSSFLVLGRYYFSGLTFGKIPRHHFF